MNRRITFLLLVVLLSLPRMAHANPEEFGAPQQPVYLVTIRGPIIPILTEYLDRALSEAERDRAICVLALDTPGGLVTTTQVMVQRMLDARVPVVMYISPPGAWAGSAGVYLTYAAHVAAMAPGTNIGAAHPVSLGMPGEGDDSNKSDDANKKRDIMGEKMENHLASYIRSLAQRNGRNAEWAEKAVRESVSLTANEALKARVVDVVAVDVPDLLRKLEGRRVEVKGGTWVLRPAPTVTRELPMDWAEAFLFTICSPGIAAFLAMFGLYGLMYEFINPGAVLPGVVGAICLLLGLYAWGQLPINYTGVALMLLAVLLFVAEVKVASHGVLSVGAIISMILGATLLVPSGYPYLAISKGTILAMVVVVGGGFIFLATVVARSLARAPLTGEAAVVGMLGRAMSDLTPQGRILVRGEIWNARSGGDIIPQGSAVRIMGVENLIMLVDAASPQASRQARSQEDVAATPVESGRSTS